MDIPMTLLRDTFFHEIASFLNCPRVQNWESFLVSNAFASHRAMHPLFAITSVQNLGFFNETSFKKTKIILIII